MPCSFPAGPNRKPITNKHITIALSLHTNNPSARKTTSPLYHYVYIQIQRYVTAPIKALNHHLPQPEAINGLCPYNQSLVHIISTTTPTVPQKQHLPLYITASSSHQSREHPDHSQPKKHLALYISEFPVKISATTNSAMRRCHSSLMSRSQRVIRLP